MESYLIDCNNCGHCSELHDPNNNDPESRKEARKRIEAAIISWLK